jgi:hypothetical protein
MSRTSYQTGSARDHGEPEGDREVRTPSGGGGSLWLPQAVVGVAFATLSGALASEGSPKRCAGVGGGAQAVSGPRRAEATGSVNFLKKIIFRLLKWLLS